MQTILNPDRSRDVGEFSTLNGLPLINGRRSRQVDTVSILPANESDQGPYLPIAGSGDAHEPFWRERSLLRQN
jgi:hypothetical protein